MTGSLITLIFRSVLSPNKTKTCSLFPLLNLEKSLQEAVCLEKILVIRKFIALVCEGA